jgi:hypothetical protein
MTCKQYLKRFFKKCRLCLFEDIEGEDGLYTRRRLHYRAFRVNPTWKLRRSGRFHGYSIMTDDDVVLMEERFSGAPFVLPPAGGSIEINLEKIFLGPYTIGEMFEKKEKRQGVNHAEGLQRTILQGPSDPHGEDEDDPRRREAAQSITHSRT